MRSIVNYVTILALLVSTTGCMTLQPLESHDTLTDLVKAGNKVEAIEKDGHINQFTVGKVNDEFIAGNDEHGSLVSIALTNIETVSVEKINGTRTTLIIVGGVVVGTIALLAVGSVVAVAACFLGAC